MCDDERYHYALGNELEELLIAEGVAAEGSVDHALKGKHYKRGLRCLKLMYEALMSQLVKISLVPNLAGETKKNFSILGDQSVIPESRVAAHKTLNEDAYLAHLVDDLLTHVECSDMIDYWKDFCL